MLEVKNISVDTKKKNILDNFSLQLNQKQIIGLTGQSGSGKTTLIRATMGFLSRECSLTSGSITLDGKELTNLSFNKRRELCGTTIGYIPQSPMTSFDPRLKIGEQMIETLKVRLKKNLEECKILALEALEMVNLTDGKRVMESIPAQLSGGMLQRVAMALLISMKPKYILADEPTSALDIENRDLLLKLLKEECTSAGILFISHDVESMLKLCETVIVLKHGRSIEQGSMAELLTSPKQLWTKTFAKSYSNLEREEWSWREL